MSLGLKVAIIKNWRKYSLPHVMCGFVFENDFRCFGTATVTFGDGSSIECDDPSDLIVTAIDADEIPD
ncbi:hypothetical protein B0T40_03110 [Chromobacterium haemolyticum]|uniref:hypothetical protein n=1 Tax=Chromobacterium haemolyticum TaxID=394935 RepID=UPI0009DAF973|nr:hypothetical protein [Chromobacterium haemolyticum]OQS39738.1 hypothetical protein B0T40_03110 [Chromobacterium haemolyticum]